MNAFVVEGLDFFAEVPSLDDQLPSAKDVEETVVILVLRDMRDISSTGLRWFDRYFKTIQAAGSKLILADVQPEVMEVLEKSGYVDKIGKENIIPTTFRVFGAEDVAWDLGLKYSGGYVAARGCASRWWSKLDVCK